MPSPTPIEIRPTSIPVRYSGNGYGLVLLDNPPAPALLHIVGGGCEEVFFARGQDSDGNVDLLIQSETAYDGVRLINRTPDQQIVVIDITTSCAWSIEIQPVDDAEVVMSPGSITRTGDYVFRVAGPVRIARNERTPDTPFFAFGYVAGEWSHNTSIFARSHDAALLPAGVSLIEVHASDMWTITLEE